MSRQSELAALGRVSDTGALSNRNLIINGKFEVNQYNDGSSTSVSSGASDVADRFSYYTNAGAIAVYSATHEISTDAPTGFEKSLKITCTSGGSIPATGEVLFRQKIEGYNISPLGYGSAEAKDATLSFWIKASVTGDYGVQFVYNDGSSDQFYVSKYTVNTANTWEYKTVTIPPQTSNGFGNTTNGLGLQCYWDWGEGSTYSGTADAGWTTTYQNGLSGGVKLMENTGATWQITGVQLEVGDTATEFEHRSYGDELARCQRYYEILSNTGANSTPASYSSVGGGKFYCTPMTYAVTKRATPTATIDGGSAYWTIPGIQGYGASGTKTWGTVGLDATAVTPYANHVSGNATPVNAYVYRWEATLEVILDAEL